MNKIEAEKIYQKIRKKHVKYDEAIHCPLILQTIANTGRVSAFCKAITISETNFYLWINKYKLLRECYGIAQIYAQEDWEKEYIDNVGNEEWDKKEWLQRGSRYFAKDKTKLKVQIDPKSNPWEQYQQIMEQATTGEFNASEIKQLMESVNVGTRVYESFKLQTEVDKMRNDLIEMSQRNGNDNFTINEIETANQIALSDKIRD